MYIQYFTVIMALCRCICMYLSLSRSSKYYLEFIILTIYHNYIITIL
jgi:hypothetical protein